VPVRLVGWETQLLALDFIYLLFFAEEKVH
jgi:hypothetical protein